MDLLGVFCVLDGFEGTFSACGERNVDLRHGVVDLQDILAVLEAFAGVEACCGGGSGNSEPRMNGERTIVTTGIGA